MKKTGITSLFIIGFIISLASCALVEPIPNTYHIAINADAQVNPDQEGRASPVVLRIYQLSSDKKFATQDFFDLYDNDKDVLENSYINKKEIELNPSESRKIHFLLDNKTRYIGFLVAYQDIDSAKWRAMVNVQARQPSGIPVYAQQGLTVNLEKNKITIESKD